MTKAKRPDIQGIRGLAITAVFAFHLNAHRFPAGFIGVDIFFVLSGYLMSSILAKEKTINLEVLRDFYTRRFKRIVPLYSILLISLFVLVPIFLLGRDVDKFITDSVWAALFATNIHSLVEKRDYFAELFDSNVLTHTWSLGVEIQYYLIVPFLISLQRVLGERYGRPYLTGLIAASFLFQCFSSVNVSFNALPSRVWQFLAGGIAHEVISWHRGRKSAKAEVKAPYSSLPSSDDVYLLEAEHIEKKGEIEIKNGLGFKSVVTGFIPTLLTIILFVLSLSPQMILRSEVLRAATIALTAVLIVLGRNEEKQSLLLTTRAIVYLGDISYVVYLVHWPVIIMWKSYWDVATLPFREVIVCIAVTLLISILVHHTLEQKFISASTSTSCSVVGVLYVLMFTAVMFSLPQKLNELVEHELTTDPCLLAAIRFNEEESHLKEHGSVRPFKDCIDDPEGIRMRDGYYRQHAYSCLWTPPNPNGAVRILVVGNSIAHRATKILHPILAKNKDVKEMRLFARAACRPLDQSHASGCEEFFAAMKKLVTRMNPDITLFIYDDSRELKSPIENINKDKPLADFVDFLKPLSENSKYLVLDEFYPKTGTLAGVSLTMYKRLLRNLPLDDLKTSYKTFMDNYAAYFKRLDQLPARFPNLIRHNTSGPLCKDGTCWWYNRENLHSYYTDHSHFTEDGLERVVGYSVTKSSQDRLPGFYLNYLVMSKKRAEVPPVVEDKEAPQPKKKAIVQQVEEKKKRINCRCGHPVQLNKVVKDSPNHGRLFYSCASDTCRHFRFLKRGEKPSPPSCSCGGIEERVSEKDSSLGRRYFACDDCSTFEWADLQ